MFAFPRERRGVAHLWHDAWVLFRQEFKSIWLFAFLSALVANLGTYWSTFNHKPPVHPILNHVSFVPGSFFHSPLENGVVMSLLWVLVTIVVNLIFTSSILLYLFRRGQGQQMRLRDAVQQVWEKYLRLLSVTLLAALTIIVGFVLGILPGIILGILWLMLPLVVLVENCKVKEAFGRSANLVWGHWWFTAYVYGVMAFVVGSASGFLIFLPARWSLFIVIFLTVWSVFAISFLSALLVNVYQELKVRKGRLE